MGISQHYRGIIPGVVCLSPLLWNVNVTTHLHQGAIYYSLMLTPVCVCVLWCVCVCVCVLVCVCV